MTWLCLIAGFALGYLMGASRRWVRECRLAMLDIFNGRGQ